MCASVNYIGYHGTSKENADDILNGSFFKSESYDQWLGEGVYFFTNGISDAREDAKNWARNMSYDPKTKTKRYGVLKVLKSIVTAEENHILDLDTDKGKIFFLAFRERFYKEIRAARKQIKGNCSDGFFIELIEKKNVTFKPLKIVKCMMAVKLKECDKISGTFSRIPNCTILSVRELDCIGETEMSLEAVV